MSDYKGIYYNDKKTPQYFEGGAHFRYKDLYFILQSLLSSNPSTHKRTFTFSPNQQSFQKPKTRNVLFYDSKHINNSNKTNSFFLQNKNTSSKKSEVINYNNVSQKQQSLNNSNVSNVVVFHKTHIKSKTNNDINYCCFNGGRSGCEKCSIINDELSKDSDERREREYKKFNVKKIKMRLFRNSNCNGNSSGMDDVNNSNISRNNNKTFKLFNNSNNKEGILIKRNDVNNNNNNSVNRSVSNKIAHAYNYNVSSSYRGNSFKNIIQRNCNVNNNNNNGFSCSNIIISRNSKNDKVTKTVYFK